MNYQIASRMLTVKRSFIRMEHLITVKQAADLYSNYLSQRVLPPADPKHTCRLRIFTPRC